jgi:branched-chain amino acid transport system substrate-binding protein
MRPSSTRCALLLAAAGSIALAAGCDSDSTAPTFTPAPTTAPVARKDDGVLTIGYMVPQDSASADIGEAIRSAVELAGSQINNAGGFNSQPVRFVRADEVVAGIGVDPAVVTLLDAGVDAIVGPASSINALASLGEIVDAGVVACSPTASAALLDDFPDKGLFFRTIPSDSLQARAIADQVNLTGATQATVVYIDDAYGQLFDEAVEAELRDQGIDPGESIPYSADNVSIAAAANRVATMGSSVVVVLGDAISGQVMLATIDNLELAVRPRYFVNDAMRRSSASAEPMGIDLSKRITGVSPLAYSTNTQFLQDLGATPDNPSPYAANAFDCVNLIALAARAGGSAIPAEIAAQIPAVSASGSPCMTFAECRDDLVLENNINYDGPGGRLTIGADGDLTEADFEVFGFDETGRDYRKLTRAVLP